MGRLRDSSRALLVQSVVGVVALVLVVLGPCSADSSPSPNRPGSQSVPATEPPSQPCISLEVSTSIEPGKVATLQTIAEEYNRSGRRVGDNRCVEVGVDGTPSGVAMGALRDGWETTLPGTPVPQVWTPTSSMWVELLREYQAFEGLPPASQITEITQSLLVVAMPQPMAEALGWPDEQVSWEQILQLAGTGWAEEGHPEWGEFTFGKDDPRRSTSGLAATVATFYAATGSRSDLRLEDLDDPETRAFVRGVEEGVLHYTDDIVTFLQDLAAYDARGEDKALSYLSAVVMQEQLVYEYNQGKYNLQDGKRPKVPLVALYPSDGTLRLNHPYVALPSASPEQQEAAADFFDYLNGQRSQQRFGDVGFRRQEDIHDPWTLSPEMAEAVGGEEEVDAASFVPPPSGAVIKAMLARWDELRKPANILLVLDTSGSMTNTTPSGATRLATMQAAVRDGLRTLPDVHQVGLWTFPTNNTGVPTRELVRLASLATSRPLIDAQIDGLGDPDGNTPLYRAVRQAHDYMAEHSSTSAINAIVVLSDGENDDPMDNSLEALLDDVDSLQREQEGRPSVRIFSIAFSNQSSYTVMNDISTRTRAEAHDASDPEAIHRVFQDVLNKF